MFGYVAKEKKINGPNIVVIGGGTGLSVLLRGLKKYTSNITAIVTVADNGGGSGILREDLGMLPPGDIRACLLALANTEPKMEKLLQYRFDTGSLKGQSFGNLFLAAMNGIYGSFEMAVKEASNVLAITGKVIPMTADNVEICAKFHNGDSIKGECNIVRMKKLNNSKIAKMFTIPNEIKPLKEGIEAIEKADLIVLGPGSLYTSVIPNLLVKGVVDAIYNSKSKKIYVSNVMTQPGETDGYNIYDHVESILKHSKKDMLDYVIVNSEEVKNGVLEKYTKDGSKQLLLTDIEREDINRLGIEIIEENLIEIDQNYIKHDNDRLSELIVEISKRSE